MTRTRSLLAVLAGALMLSGCSFDVYKLPLPGGADTGKDPLTIHVQFLDVLDLVPQSTVKVNDVSVGKVTDISLDGYVAEVELEIRRDTKLPDNAIAEIRQTSLLGEKFVSLKAPDTGASAELLGDEDKIPLERSGRNREVEEVLGALSLLLNGGGVAQLKTISAELNLALEGREGSARSVLQQLESLMGQLDDSKTDIVSAIEALNRLAVSVNSQSEVIDLALGELPSAIDSLDRQRDDLVKMLAALAKLSDVGTRVIKASKDSTISAFTELRPVLKALADAGSDLPYSFQTFLTYPFVDESVGRNPQAAARLDMGDYTNLAIQLDLNLADLPGGDETSTPCIPLAQIPSTPPLPDLSKLCDGALAAVNKCLQNPTPTNCAGLPGAVIGTVCASLPLPGLCPTGGTGGTGGLPGLPGLSLDQLTDQLDDLLGLPRAPVGSTERRGPTMGQLMSAYDADLVSLLVPGMVV